MTIYDLLMLDFKGGPAITTKDGFALCRYRDGQWFLFDDETYKTIDIFDDEEKAVEAFMKLKREKA